MKKGTVYYQTMSGVLILERKAGVQKAVASFKEGEARILYDSNAVTDEQLVAAIENSGYRVASRTVG